MMDEYIFRSKRTYGSYSMLINQRCYDELRDILIENRESAEICITKLLCKRNCYQFYPNLTFPKKVEEYSDIKQEMINYHQLRNFGTNVMFDNLISFHGAMANKPELHYAFRLLVQGKNLDKAQEIIDEYIQINSFNCELLCDSRFAKIEMK